FPLVWVCDVQAGEAQTFGETQQICDSALRLAQQISIQQAIKVGYAVGARRRLVHRRRARELDARTEQADEHRAASLTRGLARRKSTAWPCRLQILPSDKAQCYY